jgi:acetylornithine deacetylase/succinyl-diaminopimelate desuccinylase-like protein
MLLALLLLASPVDHDVLLQLLTVDTSHGHESDALRPVLKLFQAAGIPAQILESAPGRGNLIARIRGTGAQKPLLLLAHVDVVPVEGQKWDTPPFTPTRKDGYLIARGVQDDKSMASAIVAVALELAAAPQKPSRDVIVALSAAEETGGVQGVQWLLANHRDLLDAEIALNEGGDLVLTPDLARIESVKVSVAQKIYQSFRLVARGPGGHSSVPPLDRDPALQLAKAIQKVDEHRFAAHVLPEVRAALELAAKSEPAPLSQALLGAARSAPRLSPADEAALTRERIYDAYIRTTCVTTQLKGSAQENVLPAQVEAVVNCRILPGETVEGTEAALKAAIADPGIELSLVDPARIPGKAAPLEGPVPQAIRAAARKLWGEVPVVETIQLGASDSGYLRAAGIEAYDISTAPSATEDTRKGFGPHNANERAPEKWLSAGTDFLREVVRGLTISAGR